MDIHFRFLGREGYLLSLRIGILRRIDVGRLSILRLCVLIMNGANILFLGASGSSLFGPPQSPLALQKSKLFACSAYLCRISP